MARMRMLGSDELDPELRSVVRAGERTPLEIGNLRIYAQRPELARAYAQFVGALRSQSILGKRLIELVRIRVAFHNQCRSCMAVRYADAVEDGVSEDLVCSLERPEEASDLSDRERAALRFADLMATNHLAITDETFVDLKQHFTEPEIVELGMHVALDVGFGRLSSAWQMVDELPAAFRQEGRIVPWQAGAIVLH